MPDAIDPSKPETAETPAPAEAPAPKYMTVDEFNRAQSARDKRSEARFEKLLAEKLAALAPKKPEPEDDEDAPAPAAGAQAGAAGQPAPQDATARELARLKRHLEREKAEREKERGERDAQAARIARDEERTKLADALTAAGADARRVRAAVALLHTEDKRVKRDEGGRIVFLAEDGEELDLAAGVKAFLATEEGKDYLPVRPVAGSGAQGNLAPKGQARKPDGKQAAYAALVAALTGQASPR